MPQRDTYHDAVKSALIAEGWTITHDPLLLTFGRRNLYVDLGAEIPIAAEKDGRIIAVEVKSFLGVSEMRELEQALGQFAIYRFLLSKKEPDRLLYLAVTEHAFESIFSEVEGRELVEAERLNLIFNPTQERILRWV